MADTMTFPKTLDEFMEECKIVDTEQVYTNGAELVPIFRIKQWEDGQTVDAVPKRAIDADALKELKFPNGESGYATGWNDAISAIMTFQSTIEAEPHWIPCSERLPQALEEVLVTSKYGHVYTSRIVHGEFEYGGEVIAWMPLPKPYEVEI